ncbi:hypothetical protein F5880DRAFT_1138293 [Lentinula raphanica]|nr:hypothetical protein F5880DRAFT_1138293 [Lentinula raphanica]
MAYPYRCNSRRTKASRHYYYEPPPPPSTPCAGFGYDGQTCGQLVSGGGFCYAHKGQGYWDVLNHPSPEERRAHAAMGRCNGIAASTGCLCNRKIGGITFCHSHRDQQPPPKFYEDVYDYFGAPRRGSELTRRSDIVKENMMVFCRIRLEWYEGDRLFRKKAQEEAEKKKAKAAEEAARAYERFWEKEAEERKKRAEAEAKKAKEEAEKKQKEYERRV